MQKVFRTGRFWRLFIYIFGPALAALFLSVPWWMVSENSTASPLVYWLFITVTWGLGVFMLYGVVETAKWHLVVDDERIASVGWLRTRELRWKEVAGYRANSQYTFIYPSRPDLPVVKFGYTTERYAALQQRLSEQLPNLDYSEAVLEEARLVSRAELGDNTAERAARLASARRAALVLNWAGGLTCLWLIFYPTPLLYASWAGVLVPVLAIIVLFGYRPMIRLDERPSSTTPSVMLAVLGPALGLSLRSLFDVEMLTYAPLWLLMVKIGLLSAALLAFGSSDYITNGPHRKSEIASILLFVLPYSFGVSSLLNAVLDSALPTAYQTPILNKHSSTGKTTTYYLKVGPWGPRREPDDVTVSGHYYRLVAPGDTVTVLLRPGRFDIPWLIVAE